MRNAWATLVWRSVKLCVSGEKVFDIRTSSKSGNGQTTSETAGASIMIELLADSIAHAFYRTYRATSITVH